MVNYNLLYNLNSLINAASENTRNIQCSEDILDRFDELEVDGNIIDKKHNKVRINNMLDLSPVDMENFSKGAWLCQTIYGSANNTYIRMSAYTEFKGTIDGEEISSEKLRPFIDIFIATSDNSKPSEDKVIYYNENINIQIIINKRMFDMRIGNDRANEIKKIFVMTICNII
jgi:hypothetical protein